MFHGRDTLAESKKFNINKIILMVRKEKHIIKS